MRPVTRPAPDAQSNPSRDALGPTRRRLLQTGGALFVSFALGGRESLAAAGPAVAGALKPVALDKVDSFLSIDAAGTVTIYTGKVDLGTGMLTAMTQIAAEELSVPLNRVVVIQGDTLLTPDQGITFGSLSVQVGGVQLRQAAASARRALLDLGASRLKLDRELLGLDGGAVIGPDSKVRLSYGELVGGRAFDIPSDPGAPTKSPRDYTLVGKSVPRLDIPDKVSGRFTYMQDFRLPGMVHARVIRPTGVGATLLTADDAPCRAIPGYLGMVRKGRFLAVLAKNEWAAIRCSRAVVATWSQWAGLPAESDLWAHVRSTKVDKSESLQAVGDSNAAMKTPRARVLAASYDFAMHTHGSIGPSCGVAEFTNGQLKVWSASQQTHPLRQQIARMLELSPDVVRCLYVEGAGCYGRNGHEDAAADAALLARETGRPVRVQWMRQDEHGWDPKGPPTLVDCRAALDEAGSVIGWESEVFLPSRPKELAVSLLAADLASLPSDGAHPGNVQQGLAIQYGLPNVSATVHWLADTPLRPSWIRSPGRMQNTFANESFVDEICSAIGADPLAFRRRHLNDPRAAELLDRLQKLSGWQPRPAGPRPSGELLSGRGLSYVKYELVRTYVGVVADVDLVRKTGQIRVRRVYVVHDCGQVINPDGLINQVEGCVVQTVSRTLVEQLHFSRSAVTSVDWVSYPILTFPDVPEIVVELIDRPDQKPWGAGEPTASLIPSAIANAVFDASGVRLRSVPFTPAKVLATM